LPQRLVKREKFLVVLVRMKDILPVIAADNDVVKPAFEFNSSCRAMIGPKLYVQF